MFKQEKESILEAIKQLEEQKENYQLTKTMQKKIMQMIKVNQKKLDNILKFERMHQEEKKAFAAKYKYVVGIDEVGRGALAGPLVVAAVVFEVGTVILELDDSKKLSESKRIELNKQITENLQTKIKIIDEKTIDKENIYQATKNAMVSLIEQLNNENTYFLIDAMPIENYQNLKSIIKGDQNSNSIAAASIIAKVARDQIMCELDVKHPQYQFAKNKGYGTINHIKALKSDGITIHHRRSYGPVKENE